MSCRCTSSALKLLIYRFSQKKSRITTEGFVFHHGRQKELRRRESISITQNSGGGHNSGDSSQRSVIFVLWSRCGKPRQGLCSCVHREAIRRVPWWAFAGKRVCPGRIVASIRSVFPATKTSLGSTVVGGLGYERLSKKCSLHIAHFLGEKSCKMKRVIYVKPSKRLRRKDW